ncbi:hypothetical protein AMS68_003767 [Peltaster fructicola]|uniref:Phosphatidylinositol-specific phospholipase C X domain-containing protein n=1 Tax=Peltaster fructicola TaxID=286661 RepID=A0A6H0XUX7_9PEZI|nr:hypothetical protein AMS68_003767 [Peltaster fructicola]
MFARTAWLLAAAIIEAQAQSSSTSTGTSSNATQTTASSTTSVNAAFSYTQNISYITGSVPETAFTGSQYTYLSYSNQRTVASTSSSSAASNASISTSSSSNTRSTTTSTTLAVTNLVGGTQSSANDTASATSSSARPSNTLPCNNYPEFCNRQYSNITQVCAHNSAFAVKNNAASNQVLTIEQQLDDGIRMLQGETHWYNNTIQNCHTSCSLLNAGTWQSSLETLVTWLENNPFDVVTWLIVNSDFRSVEDYTASIENSGIRQYLYEPEYVPQHRDQWPTLGQMILSGKRVVMFMDYNANQTAVPYILDEFTHMWETPFSPTNQSFPCTQQRPPSLNQTVARDEYMYLANHNLNVAISLGAILGSSDDSSILIPNTAYINQTNGEYDQYGQLGAMGQNCSAQWGRPPTWLLVDYYNYGLPGPGSVFEVAAQLNGVTYTGTCCGTVASPAPTLKASMLALVGAVTFAACLLS